MVGNGERMTPLEVKATLSSPISLNRPIALDSLLASQVALRRGLVALDADHLENIEIPVQRSKCWRFHLASVGTIVGDVEAGLVQYTNRRAPVDQYLAHGNEKIRRVQINLGANKSYRIPRAVDHIEAMQWWCIGDENDVADLLSTVTHLGKRRGVGLGRVTRWTVEPCEPWDGFPVVRDGAPLRNLPLDWPGLNNPRVTMGVLSFPYWDRRNEEALACPS